MVLYRVTSSEVFHLLPQRDFAKESYEEQLESWIIKNPNIITEGETILFIKREKSLEKSEDLLGIDEEGNTMVVELKRGRTPRTVVAQALEYAARVNRMDYKMLDKIARKHFSETGQSYSDLYEAFTAYFDDISLEVLEKQINGRQRIIIVGQNLSEDVLSMADYLRAFGVDIYCVSFRYYKEDGHIIVDVDPDVRGNWEEPRVVVPPFKESDTEKFLLRIREMIMDRREDEIFYATKKPNRVLGFALDPEWQLSVGVMLDRGGELKLTVTIDYENREQNKRICETLRSTLEGYGEKVFIKERKGKKQQVDTILEWNEELLIDSDFTEKVFELLDEWIETVRGKLL